MSDSNQGLCTCSADRQTDRQTDNRRSVPLAALLTASVLLAGNLPAAHAQICDPVEAAAIIDLPTGATPNTNTVEFGSSIAISGDRVAIGARETLDGTGFVTVYLADTHPWTIEELSLRDANGGTNDQFGYHVAMDDDVLVVGAPFRDASAIIVDSGAAYIFTYSGSAWTGPVILVSPNIQTEANFGHSVAISGDLIAVAAPFENGGAITDSGAVHVFRFDSGTGTWPHVRTFTAPTVVSNDWFGFSIAMDGTTLVVGTPRRTLNGANTGAAFVYDLSDSTPANWSLTATLNDPSPSPGSHQRFGYAVAILDDVIAVGAPEDKNGVPSDNECPPVIGDTPWGTVHAFRHDGLEWGYEQRIVRPGYACTRRFGSSQPRGLFECSTDLDGLAGLYAAMERIIIQNLLRCPNASEDVPVCSSQPWLWDCNGNGIPDCTWADGRRTSDTSNAIAHSLQRASTCAIECQTICNVAVTADPGRSQSG